MHVMHLVCAISKGRGHRSTFTVSRVEESCFKRKEDKEKLQEEKAECRKEKKIPQRPCMIKIGKVRFTRSCANLNC